MVDEEGGGDAAQALPPAGEKVETLPEQVCGWSAFASWFTAVFCAPLCDNGATFFSVINETVVRQVGVACACAQVAVPSGRAGSMAPPPSSRSAAAVPSAQDVPQVRPLPKEKGVGLLGGCSAGRELVCRILCLRRHFLRSHLSRAYSFPNSFQKCVNV